MSHNAKGNQITLESKKEADPKCGFCGKITPVAVKQPIGQYGPMVQFIHYCGSCGAIWGCSFAVAPPPEVGRIVDPNTGKPAAIIKAN